MRQKKFLFAVPVMSIFMVCMLIHGCMPPEENVTRPFDYRMDREDVRRVVNHQVAQNVDSLLFYASHPDPTLRYTGALAFASIMDQEALSTLHNQLGDSVLPVAEMAAYAIGQIGDPSSVGPLTDAFRAEERDRTYDRLNCFILEAVGKCGSEIELDLLSGISTYRASDTLLVLGQVRGIFQLMLKGIANKKGTETIAGILVNESMSPRIRALCSNYFYRYRQADISDYTYSFRKLMQEERDANIRMGVGTALGRNSSGGGLPALLSILDREEDPRVQINILRGLNDNDRARAQSFIMDKIPSWDEKVQEVASSYLIAHGSEEGSFSLYDFARDGNYSPKVEANLLSAALVNLPFYYTVSRNAINQRLRARVSQTEDPYAKWAYWEALSRSPENIDYLTGLLENTQDPILRSGLTSALVSAFAYIDQDHINTKNRTDHREKLTGALVEAILSADAGSVAVAATGLEDQFDKIKNNLPDAAALKEILLKLKLPEELESYNALESLIARIEDRPPIPVESEIVRPIQWEWIDRLQPSSRAVVKTTAGDMEIRFIKDLSPHSVSNFLDLSNRGFYSNKFFHRVVPNFVIQTGCPRGDGYGSLDYNIRSEFGPLYYSGAGKVGMASAGAHTEGTQWFVTHCPAHHLDGRYSLFGEVTRGMDVLMSVKQGDKIKSVELINLK